MSDDEAVEQIRAWFYQQGYTLIGPRETRTGGGWAAPFILIGSRGGSAPYGWGDTRLESALDAKAQLESMPR